MVVIGGGGWDLPAELLLTCGEFERWIPPIGGVGVIFGFIGLCPGVNL
jgi:uncharacterized membrane protein YgdD (TMEM256/DUF423 family)